MPDQTAAALLAELCRLALLDAEVIDEAARLDCLDAASLLRALVARKALTGYQANRLAQGRGAELVLGPYLLLDPLGEGGFGQVFRVRHRSLGRVQALKLLAPHLVASGNFRMRFEREMKATAALSHPNVVTVHDAGSIDGRCFIALEYVEGSDLHGFVRQRGQLDLATACDCVRQAALGLDHAHRRGLVHRDVKPSNLLCQAGPDPPLVKVADLGLAAWVNQQTADRTPTGLIMGTPDFLAPEQAIDARRADHRADVYSLGCTLYYLFANHPPFPDGTATEKMLKHVNEVPPPLDTIRPDLPPPLVALIHQMMAKKADERPASAALVAEALTPYCVRTAAPAPRTNPPQAVRSAAETPRSIPPTNPPRSRPPPLPTSRPPTLIPPTQPPHHPSPPVPTATLAKRSRSRWLFPLLGVAAGVLLVALVAIWLTWSPEGRRQPRAEDKQKEVERHPEDDPFFAAPSSRLGGRGWRHWSDVKAMAVEPRRKWVAVVGSETEVTIFDAQGKVIRRLGDRKFLGKGLAFSPDGKWLACGGGSSGVINVWSLDDWQRSSHEHGDWVNALAFAPDGTLASAGETGQVRLHYPGTKQKSSLRGAHEPLEDKKPCTVYCLAYSPDGNWLASGDDRGDVLLWPKSSGKPFTLSGGKDKDNTTFGVAFSPDGRILAAGRRSGEIVLWDVETKQELRRCKGHESYVLGVAFLDDKTLLSVSWDTTFRIWDVATGEQKGKHRPMPSQRCDTLALPWPGAPFALVGCADGFIRRWHPTTNEVEPPDAGHLGPLYALAFSPKGDLLYSAGWDEEVRLWEWPSGRAAGELQGHTGSIHALAVRDDGKELASGAADTKVCFWDVEQRKLVRTLAYETYVHGLAYLGPDELAVGGARGTLHIYPSTAKVVGDKKAELKGHRPKYNVRLAYAPKTGLLVSAEVGFEKTAALLLWPPGKRDEPAAREEVHYDAVSGLAISSDGKTVATGDEAGTLRLYSAEGKRLAEVKSEDGAIRALAFGGDGRWLASSTMLGHVRFHDPVSGKALPKAVVLPGAATALVFSPDSKKLLTGNGNGTVGILDVPR